ncbi:AMP-binding protein [Kutzneria kofuensis]|uniref:Long-chain acyl-CoA synthetase n=1 Tax=Kutzneria kofuensis TaxID=103725 RepID=A0A7W9NH13_9PSEU|nr:AMP-binding protein [Kutzneria kofuensis]MBB5893092.1 long-chain acyl-CoA synthetase [Kutzneria kofuensis]
MTGVSNVADLVRTAAVRGADHPAFIDATTGDVLTWAEVDAATDVEARRLRDAGLQPGDRVAVRLPTSMEFAVSVFGALRAGGVVVPVSTGGPVRELTRVLDDSGASLLVGDGDGVSTKALPAPVLRVDGGLTGESVRGGEDVAVLAYTSGTSGVPRGAMLSHRALLANVAQCAALRPAPVTAADRVLLALPLFHSYGLGPGLFQVAAAGATAVLLQRFDAEAAVDAIEQHRVTTLVGVPPMYQALLHVDAARLRDALVTVRLLTSGAAPLSPSLLEAVQKATSLPVFEGYGLTETAPVLTSTLVGGQVKPGSVGRPLPGIELRLVDTDGQPFADDEEFVLPDDDAGLVSVRGENLFSGYWPDGEHGPDAEGWFRTGDVGYLDDDGDLHLVDRAGDLIIVNGFNVYPHEVEQVITELPQVAEAAVVGVPSDTTGEAVKAVLVLGQGAELTQDAVVEHCAERLAKFKVPVSVEFADVLPHSPTGKLVRSRLRLPQA